MALTNQIKNDVTMTVRTVGFKANQKICNLVKDPTSPEDDDDCLTVSSDLKVDITIKAGGLPKIYAVSA